MQAVLYYIVAFTVVAIFAATAFVTLTALVGKITIAGGYMKVLFGKLIVEVIAAFFFIFYAGATPTLPPYTGEWVGTVSWTSNWAKKLMDPTNANANFVSDNPRSEGEMYLYQASSGVYKGFSTWAVRNGEDYIASVAVTASNFKFDTSKKTLLSLDVIAFARRANTPVTYNGPSPCYTWTFTSQSSSSELFGTMTTQIGGKEVQVGTVRLARN